VKTSFAAAALVALAPLTATCARPEARNEPSVAADVAVDGDPTADWDVIYRVLVHARCLNCHPDGDRPSQGDGYPHQPPVQRGDDGHGVSAMRCATCHQKANFDPAGIPGHPEWHLAPRSMAWQHKSLADICMQLKDTSRNGGRTLDQIMEHAARDSLVGWAWKPGAGREPAPGNQASFGALMQAWADAGAACPEL